MLSAPGQARRGNAFQTPPGSRDSNGKRVSLGAAGFLSGYCCTTAGRALSSRVVLWQNTCMRHWLIPLLAILVGIAGGIFYGWVINPVKLVDTTPASLRADYRTDYVLMVAESYHADQDETLAQKRLALLGTEPPTDVAQAALQRAQQSGYAASDISLLQELTRALQASQPVPTTEGSTP